MAGTGRNRASSGPGRGTPRTRAASRPGQRPSSSGHTPRSSDSPPPPPDQQRKPFRGFHLTRRAVVLLVMVALLAVSYANTLRVYFDQQRQIAEGRAVIAEKQASIDKLQDEIKRWQDPDYVRAQARSRLGWVLPGEVGYKVVGPDGKLIGGGVELIKKGDTPESLQTWWQRLWGSVQAADEPVPTEPKAPATIMSSPTP